MITNFEEVTKELSDDEKVFLKPLINGFKCHDKDSPIKAPDIVIAMNKWATEKGVKTKFSEVRLRKLVNLIRSHSLLPLIATDKGYYCCYSHDEIKKQVASLTERAGSIMRCADGLKKFLEKPNTTSAYANV